MSFDGKERCELCSGDSVFVRMSQFPAGAYTRSHSAQLELTLPLSAQLKLTLSPI